MADSNEGSGNSEDNEESETSSPEQSETSSPEQSETSSPEQSETSSSEAPNIKDQWETYTDEEWDHFCKRILQDKNGVLDRLKQVRLDKKPNQPDIIIDKKRPYLYGIMVENHPSIPDDWKLCKIGYTDGKSTGEDQLQQSKRKIKKKYDEKNMALGLRLTDLFYLPFSATQSIDEQKTCREIESEIRKRFGWHLDSDLANTQLDLAVHTEWVITMKDFIIEFEAARGVVEKIGKQVPSTEIIYDFKTFDVHIKKKINYQSINDLNCKLRSLNFPQWLQVNSKKEVIPKKEDWQDFSVWFWKDEKNGNKVIDKLNMYCKKKGEMLPLMFRRDNYIPSKETAKKTGKKEKKKVLTN